MYTSCLLVYVYFCIFSCLNKIYLISLLELKLKIHERVAAI